MAGSKRASRRRKAGYWTRRGTITARNVLARLRRHAQRHPDDHVAAKALRRRS